MLSTETLIDEWVATRSRIADHIAMLRQAPKIHLVDDPVAIGARSALEMLLSWQEIIDETVIGLLPQPSGGDPA